MTAHMSGYANSSTPSLFQNKISYRTRPSSSPTPPSGAGTMASAFSVPGHSPRTFGGMKLPANLWRTIDTADRFSKRKVGSFLQPWSTDDEGFSRFLTTYLTSRPKIEAGRELRTLVLTLTKTDKPTFTASLTAWHTKWESFINQKTEYAFTNGKTKWH